MGEYVTMLVHAIFLAVFIRVASQDITMAIDRNTDACTTEANHE